AMHADLVAAGAAQESHAAAVDFQQRRAEASVDGDLAHLVQRVTALDFAGDTDLDVGRGNRRTPEMRIERTKECGGQCDRERVAAAHGTVVVGVPSVNSMRRASAAVTSIRPSSSTTKTWSTPSARAAARQCCGPATKIAVLAASATT